MRILYSGYSLLYPRGGAEISALTLLKELSKHHEITVIGLASATKGAFVRDSIRFFEYPIPEIIKRRYTPFHLRQYLTENYYRNTVTDHFLELKSDLMILQEPATLRKMASAFDAKVVVFIRSLDWYGIEDKNYFGLYMVNRTYNYPFFRMRHVKNRKFLKAADMLIANSDYTKRRIRNILELESSVLYPFIETKGEVPLNNHFSADYITFINMTKLKGSEIAFRIAETMGNRKFLFLKGRSPEEKQVKKTKFLHNVDSLDWTNDMEKVFSRTKLLLMPSIWEEPFGRIAIEAQIRGIPVIGSAHGGLSESIGPGGSMINDNTNIDSWVTEIKKYDSTAYYRSASEKCIEHAKMFYFPVVFSHFKKIFKEKLELYL